MRRFTPTQVHVKHYATEERLDRAIIDAFFEDLPHILYRFEDGRVTAIFFSEGDGAVRSAVAQRGFAVVG